MDRPDLEPDQPPPPLSMKKPNLTSEERRSIVSALLLTVKPGDPNLKLSHGALTAVARDFNVNRKTIKKIWDRALANYHDPHVRAFVSSPQKRTNSGRKQLYDRDEVRAAIKQLPLYQRKTLRSLAAALGISKSTLFRMKESELDKVIVPSTTSKEPFLK
jgi:transposase-like protein